MKLIILNLSFFLISALVYPQKQDTINRRGGEYNKKQGHWVISAKDLGKCTNEKQKIEEGNYIDDKKTGVWTEYYCNGNVKGVITYFNNRPNGAAKLFYESGKIKEEGTWKNNHWVGEYKQYTEDGKVTEYCFDMNGKREGRPTVNTECVFPGEVSDFFTKDTTCYIDSASLRYCSCDSFKIISPAIKREEKEKGVFDGKGTCWTSTLYNKDKQISKCGFFQKNRLVYGLAYYYDFSGKLVETKQYFKGKYIGHCNTNTFSTENDNEFIISGKPIDTSFYKSGAIEKIEYQYKDKAVFYENGQLKSKSVNGSDRKWYENGQLKSQSILRGNHHRAETEWYENGQLKASGSMSWGNNKNTRAGEWIKNADWKYWEKQLVIFSKPDTLINNKLYVRDSLKNVLAILFFEEGIYQYEIDRKTGKKIEQPKKTNQITEDGLILNGKLVNGKKYIYNNDGIILRIMIFKDGCYLGDAIIEE